ncbi:MAG: hypothetical protein JXL80_16175 [Planctomycetes bacterium]|nr:hypothetical protein [Planctomycetota bacterium]
MRRYVMAVAILAALGSAVGAAVFSQAPEGTYDGPVKTVYTQANAPATPKPGDLDETDTITQYGITWKLKGKARVGRFITGDYYVVGPVTVIEITPKPLFGAEVEAAGWTLINEGSVKEEKYKNQWARNGSTLNQPVDTLHGGLDSRTSDGFYDPKLFAKLPIKMAPGDALISSISTPEPIKHDGHGQPVGTGAVLTCLKEPVPADAFRPSYCDRKQTIYLARNLKRELLYALPRPKEAPADMSEWARVFQRPWLDTVAWGYANPKDNLPRYGQWITRGSSSAAILLHLDYPPEEKEKLLVGYVQYGVDLWGVVRSGYKGWWGQGGFGGGRKWALVFAGLMLGDNTMRDVSKTYPKVQFGEDQQTKTGKSWTGHNVLFESHPGWRPHYTDSRPLSEWTGGEIQSESYRRCCTSAEWPGQALAAHLMRAEKYFNHDAFYAYVDRWMTEDHIDELKKIRAASQEHGKFKWVGWWDRVIDSGHVSPTNPLFQVLWDKYRNDLPPAK